MTEQRKNNWWTKFLVYIGWLSNCCQAKTYYDVGYDSNFCSKCDNRCR